MNGANWGDSRASSYLPTITSYGRLPSHDQLCDHVTLTWPDYGAPLSENGDVTQKYQEIRKVIQEKEPNSMGKSSLWITTPYTTMSYLNTYAVFNPLPSIPNNIPTASYGDMKLTLYMSILETLNYLPVSMWVTWPSCDYHCVVT